MPRNMPLNSRPRMDTMLKLVTNNPWRDGLRAEASGEEVSIYVYDVIDDYWGISAKVFAEAMAAAAGKTVHLRINSPGGDVFAARAMVAAMRAHSGKIIAHIDGLAASAASFLAVSAHEVRATQGAFFMIHKAWTVAMGNVDDLLATADLLEKVDASIVADYVRKTGQSEQQVIDWMAAETWFSADEAKAAGFVDQVFEGEAAGNRWNLEAFDRAPAAALRNRNDQDAQLQASRAHLERRLALFEKCPA